MKIPKSLAIGAATLAGIATLGAGIVFAAEKTNMIPTNPMSGIVTAIATTFNLKASDVQAVVDQERQIEQQQMDAKRAEMEKTRLDAAVKSGTITQVQEDLIITKQAEMKTTMESLADKTQTEREAAMKTQMDALKQWATDNKIPEQFMMFGGGRHGGPGPMGGDRGHGPDGAGGSFAGFGGPHGGPDAQNATSTPSAQ